MFCANFYYVNLGVTQWTDERPSTRLVCGLLPNLQQVFDLLGCKGRKQNSFVEVRILSDMWEQLTPLT